MRQNEMKPGILLGKPVSGSPLSSAVLKQVAYRLSASISKGL